MPSAHKQGGRHRQSIAHDLLCTLDSLEQRVLLSAVVEMPAGYVASVPWRGVEVEAISGSWVASFDQELGPDRAETAALYLAGQLGVSVEMVHGIGRGYNAEFRTTDTVSEQRIDELVGELDWLRAIEPNFLYQSTAVPNDPLFSQQWQLENNGQTIPGSGAGTIGADANAVPAWDTTIGSSDVVVAVIDTGVQLDHPDLAANIWQNPLEIAGNGIDDDGNGLVDDINGFDFGEFDNDPSDAAGHGTLVAGTIGAVGNNGIGVAGVAWNVSIMALKIADQFGALSNAAILGAHDYATAMREAGIDVVASNNSYGAFAPAFYADFGGSIAEQDAIQRFIDSGGVFVAAAGNDGFDIDAQDPNDLTHYPAAYPIPGIISVAATDNNNTLAGFSNFGAQNVDLAAPGVSVRTTALGSTYAYVNGTSFSSPMVAGTVALMRTIRPNASGEELRQVLIDSSAPLPTLQNKVVSGGTLDIAEALRIISLDGPVITAIDPGPVTGQLNAQGLPVSEATVSFNRDLNPSFLNPGLVSLVGAGPDETFGTGDDLAVTIQTVDAVDARSVLIDFDTSAFLQQRLPIGKYRLTLNAAGFRDTDGNFLNGDGNSGTSEVYDFNVVAATGSFEPNDSLDTAEDVSFIASGSASFTGLSIGDGVRAGLDVDLFRVDIPRGGLIRAETFAQNRVGGSTLDSVLRLFDGVGNELVSNDQFNGQDSLVDYFVSTGGSYYVGVSGFGNSAYDPSIPGSGQSQSTGIYDLRIDVELIQEDRVTASHDLSADPSRIPPQGTQGTFSDSLTFNDARDIRDINVRVNLTHDFTGDLRISLFAPDNTEIVLSNRHGGSGNNYTNTLFDDEATVAIADGVAPFDRSGGYRPDGELSQLDGGSAAGLWTIVVQDTTALNTGFFLGWSIDFTLANDIFGPFESNDTLPTASDVPTINGSGTASIDATIGDGGFGLLDRDLYKLDVAAGSTLNTTATSADTLNAALVLFDENGSKLKIANPAGTNNANISNFVFTEGGTFYLGVSESANTAYDPFSVTSGTAAESTGDYTLAITVVPGVSDRPIVLAGEADAVSAGAAADGIFLAGTGSGRTGLALGSNEFLFDTSSNANPLYFFGAAANGFTFRNDGPGGETGIPVALTDQSDVFNRRMVDQGMFRGLSLERSFSFGVNDSFVAVDVVLTNTTATTITGVTWMEGFNPEQGLNQAQGTSAATANDVLDGSPLAMASFSNNNFPLGLSIALAAPASDTRAEATFFDPSATIRDPDQLLGTMVDPNGAIADQAMALAYDLGNVPAGQAVSMRYFILMGGSQSEITGLYDQINNGTGTGHLTADSANPADETLLTDAGDTNDQAPTLPYRFYYPEGFANPNTSTFVPITNPHDQPTRVVLIARYENGARDQIIADQTIAPNARGGVTITDPARFAAGTQKVRGVTPYAVEIRAERPVAANFSHYDDFLIANGRAALGETFTNRVDPTWTFGSVTKGAGERDFLLFQNTSDQTVKITTTFFSADGESFEIIRTVEPYRRSGIDVKKAPVEGTGQKLPDGSYGVVVQAEDNIVAVLSHYDSNNAQAFGATGAPGGSALRGAIPEGQIGLNSTNERIGVLNPGSQTAQVLFSFLFQNGTSYRTNLAVDASSRAELVVENLPNFPSGQPYSVFYESDQPISLTMPTAVFGDTFATDFTSQAYTLWGFGEGFRPKKDGKVEEYLRLFNPTDADVLVEITLHFDGDGGTETFRRTLPGRRVQEFDIHEFVTGDRRNAPSFYGLTIKAAEPIVAYMGHFDSFFPGGFGTLGVPLGSSTLL